MKTQKTSSREANLSGGIIAIISVLTLIIIISSFTFYIEEENLTSLSLTWLLLTPLKIYMNEEALIILLNLGVQFLYTPDLALLSIMWFLIICFICISCPLISLLGDLSVSDGLKIFTSLFIIFGGIFCLAALARGPYYVNPLVFKTYIVCLTYLLGTQPATWQVFLFLNVLLSIRPDATLPFIYLATKLSLTEYAGVLITTTPYLINCMNAIGVSRLFFLTLLSIFTLNFLAFLGSFLHITVKNFLARPHFLAEHENRNRVPVLGVRGSGKTYFICSLAYIVSRYGWGHPDSETSLYINELLEYVFKGELIPSTYKSRPIRVELKEIDLDGKKRRLNLVLSTEDYSGKEYENFMKKVKDAMLSGTVEKLGPEAEKFKRMMMNSRGVIVIVDLVGKSPLTPEEFKKRGEKGILDALSEQVVPLATSIELLLDSGVKLSNMPFFFVFTKSDIHRLTSDEASKYLNEAMAISLSRLRSKGVVFRYHVVSSIGWGPGGTIDKLYAKGFIELVKDIAELIKG